jgi:purine-binding chemotaxis protein CheW
MDTDKSTPEEQEGRTFDWEGARRRIAEVTTTLAGLGETTPEELHEAWAQRAARLAQAPAQEEEGERIELVLIRLGLETYGLDAEHVFEIKIAEQITRIPRVPDWVAGVVNLRGRILSVLDLRRLFGLPADEGPDGNDNTEEDGGLRHLIVVTTPDMEIALLADDVTTVEALPADQIQSAESTVRGIRPEYVRGVVTRTKENVKDQDGILVVLDLPALLADEGLIIHEEIV